MEEIMKKIISLLLALVLTFSLVGCGNSDDLKAMVGSYELTGLVDPDVSYNSNYSAISLKFLWLILHD